MKPLLNLIVTAIIVGVLGLHDAAASCALDSPGQAISSHQEFMELLSTCSPEQQIEIYLGVQHPIHPDYILEREVGKLGAAIVPAILDRFENAPNVWESFPERSRLLSLLRSMQYQGSYDVAGDEELVERLEATIESSTVTGNPESEFLDEFRQNLREDMELIWAAGK